MVDLARRAGVQRIIIDGSFVADALEPNDVDCVLLLGPGYPTDAAAGEQLAAGLAFLEMRLVEHVEFDYFVGEFFATDRDAVPKGMIEVVS